jgi:hypothetical protein
MPGCLRTTVADWSPDGNAKKNPKPATAVVHRFQCLDRQREGDVLSGQSIRSVRTELELDLISLERDIRDNT